MTFAQCYSMAKAVINFVSDHSPDWLLFHSISSAHLVHKKFLPLLYFCFVSINQFK